MRLVTLALVGGSIALVKPRRAFVVAALVHVGLLGALARVSLEHPKPRVPVANAANEEEGIAIDLTSPPAPPIAVASPSPLVALTTPRPIAAPVREPQVDPSPTPTLMPLTPTLTPTPTLTLTLTRPPASLGLTLGAPNPFIPRSMATEPEPAKSEAVYGARPVAPTPAEAKEHVEASLAVAARDRDHDVGLGPEGPVLTALQDATMASRAPVVGHAVFVAVADSHGYVESVVVESCNGSPSDWDDAARRAHAALKGRPLRVAGAALKNFTKKTTLKVDVVSALKMPSGHDAGVDTTVLGLPIKKGGGAHSTKVAVLNPIPRIENHFVEIAPGVKTVVPVTEWDVLAIQGDPVDLGAKPRRVVHTKLIAVHST